MTEEKCLQRKQAADAFAAEFQKQTSQRIRSFFDVVLGFDVIKWDSWLEVPDGESTAQVTTKRYGEGFMEKIRALL